MAYTGAFIFHNIKYGLQVFLDSLHDSVPVKAIVLEDLRAGSGDDRSVRKGLLDNLCRAVC